MVHLVWAAKGTRRCDWFKGKSADFPTNRSSTFIGHLKPTPATRTSPSHVPEPLPSLIPTSRCPHCTKCTPPTHRHPYQALNHQHSASHIHQNPRVGGSRAGFKVWRPKPDRTRVANHTSKERGEASASLIF